MPTFTIGSGENSLKEGGVPNAIKSINDGKAIGAIEISTEIFKTSEEENVSPLIQLRKIM